MYNEQIEGLISAALADGVLTEKEKQILFKKAQNMGIDLDEFEMVLDARLVELEKAEKEKAEKSAPKSNKYGDVRKCPVCGALVPALGGVCPECGYEFSGVDATPSAKELANKLAAVKESYNSVDQKIEIIEHFPLPNTKADIIGFIQAAKPHILDENDPLATAYFKKYQECISKAKMSFINDKLVETLVAEFDNIEKAYQTIKKRERKKNVLKWAYNHKIFISCIFVVVIGIIWFAQIYYEETAPTRCEDSVIEFVQEGKLEEALNLYNEGKVKYNNQYHDDWGEKAGFEIFKLLIEKNDIGKAEEFFNEEYMNYSSYKANAEEILTKAYMKNNLIDRYWALFSSMYSEPENHEKRFEIMKNVVNFYCKKGEIYKAKSFVNKNIDWFYTNIDKDNLINKEGGLFESGHKNWQDYKSSKVREKLNAIISSY